MQTARFVKSFLPYCLTSVYVTAMYMFYLQCIFHVSNPATGCNT